MINQVLSISQMQELKELGIDISKASMKWVRSITREHCEAIPMSIPLSKKSTAETVPAFTLEDILNILGNYYQQIQIYQFDFNGITQYNIEIPQVKSITTDISLLETSYKLLIWCLDNNYIK